MPSKEQGEDGYRLKCYTRVSSKSTEVDAMPKIKRFEAALAAELHLIRRRETLRLASVLPIYSLYQNGSKVKLASPKSSGT
jgi:hypothetical protein